MLIHLCSAQNVVEVFRQKVNIVCIVVIRSDILHLFRQGQHGGIGVLGAQQGHMQQILVRSR